MYEATKSWCVASALSFIRHRGGAIALKFALMLPALLLAAGGAIDYTSVAAQKVRLQAAIDAGALAAAKELGLSDARTENVQAIVEAVVKSYAAANAASRTAPSVALTTQVGNDPLQVNVKGVQTTVLPFGGGAFIGLDSLTATSTARVVGRPNVCVLGLDPGESGTIELLHQARVTGNDCAVYSNSDSSNGIKAKNDAKLVANLICTRGGKDSGVGAFVPEPIVDCPSFEDPLAARPEPAAGPCLETDLVISGQARSLAPGTYCGGLKITGASVVTLDPGIYVIKDGPLVVDGGSALEGNGVGFYYTGAGAQFDFEPLSSIALEAPDSGDMAGLLMFEGRSQPKGKHKILSDDARVLLGTIYLSRSELYVEGSKPVADKSAYTAIVARTMRLGGGPHLILNTNYSDTNVPVPEGIKGTGQPLALVN